MFKWLLRPGSGRPNRARGRLSPEPLTEITHITPALLSSSSPRSNKLDNPKGLRAMSPWPVIPAGPTIRSLTSRDFPPINSVIFPPLIYSFYSCEFSPFILRFHRIGRHPPDIYHSRINPFQP